jgi:hypothetical protein
VPRTSIIALAVVCATATTACPPKGEEPCFPSDTPQELPWLSHQTLTWDIDTMAQIEWAPEATTPPSEVFLRAQRDMKTEFWLDAAKGWLPVALGETGDTRAVRQVAQYQLGVALFRLRYFAEALRLFKDVAAARSHPLRDAADRWVRRAACAG